MLRKILNAASWLSLVQLMNLLSVIVLSVLVIRHTDTASVAAYMYAVFVTDAVLSYTLLQIGQRITLAGDDRAFAQLFAYSRIFGAGNAVLALLVVAFAVGLSDQAHPAQTLYFVGWLTVAGIANYFAQIYFSVCDYKFEYRVFGLSSAAANIVSLLIAVASFTLGAGIFSMVIRDVARAAILLALALRSARALAPALGADEALDRHSKREFWSFLIKRHTLKVIEVSNHRVPALVMSAGNLSSLGNFGVAFQLISQIMNMLTVAGDKLAYSFFARGQRAGKLRFLAAVTGMYAIAGLLIFTWGEPLFALIYGPQWRESATTFSYLGLYLFTHGSLVVITNYLITEQRFAGIYLSWAGWTLTFIVTFMLDRGWPIAGYYLVASLVSFLLAVGSLFLAQSQALRDGGATLSGPAEKAV